MLMQRGNRSMMKKNKLVLGIVGALIMFVCSFFLAFYTIRDYYIARSGVRVQARVVENSDVCNKWNKFIAVEYAKKITDIRLYGPDCRAREFGANQLIHLRRSGDGDLLVLESNRYVFRVWFMSVIFLLTLIVNILMYNQYRFWKNANRINAGLA
jgi:hypothetical protein